MPTTRVDYGQTPAGSEPDRGCFGPPQRVRLVKADSGAQGGPDRFLSLRRHPFFSLALRFRGNHFLTLGGRFAPHLAITASSLSSRTFMSASEVPGSEACVVSDV